MKNINIKEKLITQRGGTFYVQSTFLPDSIISLIEEEFEGRKRCQAFKIIDRVYSKLKQLDTPVDVGHSFSSSYKKEIGSSSTEIWGELVRMGLLVCNNSYSVGREGKVYKIHPAHLNTPLKRVDYLVYVPSKAKVESFALETLLSTNLDINQDLIPAFVDSFRPDIKNEIVGNTIQFKNGNLSYWNGDKRNFIEKPLNLSPEEHFISFVGTTLENRIKSHQEALNTLKMKTFSFPRRNNTNNRLNHIITNLPSRYIPYCRLEGEELSEIDFKNSQFTLLANLFNNTDNQLLTQYIYLDNYYINKPSLRKDAYYELLHNFKPLKDVRLFQEYCFNGVVYEELSMDLFGETNESTRNVIKKLMFGFLFGDVKHMNKGKVFGLFNTRFPNVVKFIKLIKLNFYIDIAQMSEEDYLKLVKKHKYIGRYKASMNYLAIALQRIESRIFIDEIYDTFRIIGIPALSKHDSILVKKSDKDKALEIIQCKLNEILGEGHFSLRFSD